MADPAHPTTITLAAALLPPLPLCTIRPEDVLLPDHLHARRLRPPVADEATLREHAGADMGWRTDMRQIDCNMTICTRSCRHNPETHECGKDCKDW